MADPSRVRISGVLQPFAVGSAAELRSAFPRHAHVPASRSTRGLPAPRSPDAPFRRGAGRAGLHPDSTPSDRAYSIASSRLPTPALR